MLRLKLSLSKHQTIILGVVTILLAVAGIFFIRSVSTNNTPAPTITTKDGKKVTLAPPTKEEKQEVEDHKSELVKATAYNSSDSTTQTKTSNVIITSPTLANPSPQGVRAYVSGVFEDTGTCTATATQGTTTVSKSSAGFENVSYTQCAPIDWDSPLGKGKWTITLSYKSVSTTSSQSVAIEVK